MLILELEDYKMNKYVEMTVEEALEYSRGNKNMKVLVMVSDMESTNDIAAFARRTKAECDSIIKQAQTIAHECDEFMVDSLHCYSMKQNLRELQPIGKVSTILFKIE